MVLHSFLIDLPCPRGARHVQRHLLSEKKTTNSVAERQKMAGNGHRHSASPLAPCVPRNTLHKGLRVRFAAGWLASDPRGRIRNPHIRISFIPDAAPSSNTVLRQIGARRHVAATCSRCRGGIGRSEGRRGRRPAVPGPAQKWSYTCGKVGISIECGRCSRRWSARPAPPSLCRCPPPAGR